MKPNSQEFFTEFDPLYRTYDKQAALRKQKELFATVPQVDELWGEYNARFKALGNWARNAADPFDVTLARGREGESLKSAWERHRQGRVGFADARHPFQLQGSADLNSYKMFAEVFWTLLRGDGRIGVILPTGIYSDFGTKDLREAFLFGGRLDFLYGFQNEKKVFPAALHLFKQVVLIATKGAVTAYFRTRFRMGVADSPEAQEIPDDILSHDEVAMVFTPEDVRSNSPKTLSFVELKSRRDLDIFRMIYAHSIRIGDNTPGWEISYAREFDMTNDSKHFPALDKWEAKGYNPDGLGRWRGPGGDEALPLYQGGMVHILNPFYNGWSDGEWRRITSDNANPLPKFLMSSLTYRENSQYHNRPRIVYRRITNTSNLRTFIGSFSPPSPAGDSLFLLLFEENETARPLSTVAVCGSLVFDWTLRQRMTGTNLSWFVLQECPLPTFLSNKRSALMQPLALRASRLCLIHRRFAPEWLRFRQSEPALSTKQWKHWWAITEADRLRLRVEIDALCADHYGLTPDDFDWIVRDDPTDPRGFYRVDRHLPFRERLTGLAAAAFRALKDGKWSAESAATLSNDEFFTLIGIPEMTTGPDPLIRKRDGCHRWKPEEFGPDDARRGWTWDDCWNDAVALLGSEDAVREYIEGKQEQPTEERQEDGRTDLFGEPLPPKQGRLF
jgi:hypothetical protein